MNQETRQKKQETKSETPKAGPTAISTTLKQQLADSRKETPSDVRFKSEAKGQRHLIQPTQGQVGVLSQYMKHIGADKNVLSSDPDEDRRDKRNRMIYMEWFQALVIQNQRFPRNIPVKFVLAHFARKVVQNDVQIKGFNLREQVRAFHEYLDSYEHELRSKWWQYQHPGDRPKVLPESATISDEEQQASDEERAQTIKALYGADGVPESLNKFTKSQSNQ